MSFLSNQGKAEKKQADSNYRIPGVRMGPRNFAPIEKPQNSRTTLARLMTYFTKEKYLILGLIAAVSITVGCSIYTPSLQSKAVDTIAAGIYDSLTPILLLMLLVYVIYAVMNLLQNLISANLSQRIVKKLREDLFHKITRLPVKYLDTHAHGDIMSRMTNDVENISNTVSQSLGSLVSGILTVSGTVIVMFCYCWELALLSCTTVILTVVATKYLSKTMRKFFLKRQILLGGLNGIVEEKVIGYKTVVAYNRQKEVIEEFEKNADELTKVGIIADIFGGSMGPVMNAINNIGFVIIAAFGGYFAIKDMISIGVVSAFIVYAKQFSRPINEIAQVYGQIQTAIAGAERIFVVLDENSEDVGGNQKMEGAKGVITFKNVTFGYTKENPVLHDFDLEIYAGHKVALVGATGSGKTTVVNLLMRYYEPDSGEILIDGINIRDLSMEELRRNIAIVLQDTVLFSDTIRNNLKYSRLDASDKEMEEAAAMSNSAGLIKHLPKGYDTMLSESGQNLSQGQRQLISIGRAFLANPKILILDEATSSVDTRTEKHIQDAMVRLMKERTSIIIAHRLSTIQDADFIVVLDQGHIVESGNHEELLQKKGRYHELYMTQFEGREI